MTPPELDAETKARIEAEEAYRREVQGRASLPLMDRDRVIALTGAGLIAVGVFAPALSMPLIGGVNLIGTGNRDGIILLGLVTLSVLLTFVARHWLVFSGLLSALFIVVKIVDLNALRSSSTQMVELGWGWVPMIVGTIMVVWAGFTAR